jgi:hypothetical protein
MPGELGWNSKSSSMRLRSLSFMGNYKIIIGYLELWRIIKAWCWGKRVG